MFNVGFLYLNINIEAINENGCDDLECKSCLDDTKCKTCYYGWMLKDGFCLDCPAGTYYETSN